MSNVTIEDLVNEQVPNAAEVDIAEKFQETINEESNSQAKELLSRVFSAETGEGSIGDYLHHPMNFNNSMGLAQILRGMTGIVGNLKLAIIDVVVGFLRFSREKKGVIKHDLPNGSNFPS